MDISDLDKYFARLTISLQKTLSKDLPIKVGNLAVRLFKENFQKESFFGRAWQEVKRRIKGAKGAASKRKILSGPTGNLGRSIQFIPRDGAVDVVSDLHYSAAHNQGTDNAGRSHNVRIPQRQFIGDSHELEQAVRKKVIEEINKALKP